MANLALNNRLPPPLGALIVSYAKSSIPKRAKDLERLLGARKRTIWYHWHDFEKDKHTYGLSLDPELVKEYKRQGYQFHAIEVRFPSKTRALSLGVRMSWIHREDGSFVHKFLHIWDTEEGSEASSWHETKLP